MRGKGREDAAEDGAASAPRALVVGHMLGPRREEAKSRGRKERMSADPAKAAKGKMVKPMNQETIVAGFNQLRQEQRSLAGKVAELESDANEHSLVLDALKDVDLERKCFRMIGGVLVERTVKEVLPSLEKNKEMITKLIDNLKAQVVVKGKQINEYMDKHNIQIRQESVLNEEARSKSEGDSVEKGGPSGASSGVLVASGTSAD